MFNFQKLLLLGVLVFSVLFLNQSGNLTTGVVSERDTQTGTITAPMGEASSILSAEDSMRGDPPRREEGRGMSVFEQSALQSATAFKKPIFYRVFEADPPPIAAQTALLADLESGEAYFELSPDRRWPVASVTKLMTAAVVFGRMNEDEVITLLEKDFPLASNSNGVKAGERYRAGDLLAAMLVYSSNEAAEALSNAYGRELFMKSMNEKAKELGLRDTFFGDPTGLSATNQSTASNLRALLSYLYEYKQEILRITRRPSVTLTEAQSGASHTFSNINLFAGQVGFLGGKTGYTDEANGNLVSVFSHEARPIAVIVLGTSDRFGDTSRLITWFRNAYRSSR